MSDTEALMIAKTAVGQLSDAIAEVAADNYVSEPVHMLATKLQIAIGEMRWHIQQAQYASKHARNFSMALDRVEDRLGAIEGMLSQIDPHTGKKSMPEATNGAE